MVAQYAFRATSLQRYIFDSNRLVEIAGASQLIESLKTLPEELMQALGVTGDLVFAAAGNFQVSFEERADAELFSAHVPMALHSRIPGLSFAHTLAADETGWEMLPVYLSAERNRMIATLPQPGPLVMRSPRTAEAVIGIGRVRQQSEAMDAASLAKVEAYEGGRILELERRLQALVQPLFETPLRSPCWASDIDKMVGEGEYLAVVHIDGNGMGQFLMKLNAALRDLPHGDRVALWRSVSDSIGKIGEAAFREAVLKAGLRPDNDGKLPGRPVVMGGDDLTILLRAAQAPMFAAEFCRSFEKIAKVELEALQRKESALAGISSRLTASAGIAFVKPHHPFVSAYQLCESLCKLAKQIPAEADSVRPAAIAFHRVSAGTVDDYRDIMASELTVAKGALMSLNPYSLRGDPEGGTAAFDDLLALAMSLAKLPRGPWRRLAQGLYETANPIIALQRAAVVAEGSIEKVTAFEAFRDALARLTGSPDEVYREIDPTTKGSPLLDALTLIAVGVVQKEHQDDD